MRGRAEAHVNDAREGCIGNGERRPVHAIIGPIGTNNPSSSAQTHPRIGIRHRCGPPKVAPIGRSAASDAAAASFIIVGAHRGRVEPVQRRDGVGSDDRAEIARTGCEVFANHQASLGPSVARVQPRDAHLDVEVIGVDAPGIAEAVVIIPDIASAGNNFEVVDVRRSGPFLHWISGQSDRAIIDQATAEGEHLPVN